MRTLLDLFFPAVCVGCGRTTDPLCHACSVPLGAAATLSLPQPCPAGLPPPYAVAPYAGSVRAAVVAYKDRDAVGLTAPLAAALRRSVDAATAGLGTPPLFVAVPSSRAASRRRGYDPVLRLARAAGCRPVRGALVHVRRVRDSAGLSAAARAGNMARALSVPVQLRPALQGRTVVVLDDVITTGATLAEAARALRAAGALVPSAAVVAATRRTRARLRSE